MSGWILAGSIIGHDVIGLFSIVVGLIKNNKGRNWYMALQKPRWYPPDGLVGIAWTVWFGLMGYSSYLVYRDCGGFTERSILPFTVHAVHFVITCTWTPFFMWTRSVTVGLVHILLLDLSAAATAGVFGTINRTALYAMLPYLTWMVFDTSLMVWVWKNNTHGELIKDDK